ncbi:PAS domain-containing sensor histidine kinase [Mucilaginibacter gotjawali]|uniref:histidine kinase n=2 Tax=Mucilaginibacter gotjawali TaxID=1550579 RepID=A0A120MYU3_9SPHI|nr:ATP-binding protein [Mucilaginibacter gotjawali]MBB3058689.1 two-component system CheB/CheR fusion protein [Mucilaginibacter gotjawali]BAU55841.1 Alkaline phosphatase synthesis sensor protein PhoR [Mucilaginibacter gotjawali]
MDRAKITYEQLLSENEELRLQLEEANDTVEAIRTGQVDALIVNNGEGHQIYTLKTADQTYRVFIEKMNEGAVTINHEGIILYSNTRFAMMVNLPLEKTIGLQFNLFIPEIFREAFDRLISNAWNEDCKEEIELISSAERLVPCLLSCNTLELDEGTALSLILTDLTVLKDAEKQLKIKNLQLAAAHMVTEKLNNQLEDTVKERTNELFLSREHFKFLANNIPQMTWTNLPNGEIDYFNQQWYAYTGLGTDESKGLGWQKAIHPDDLALTLQRYQLAIKTGTALEMENRYKRGGDGVYRWHLNRAVPLKNEMGAIVFWVGTATDIEDQKKEMEKRDEFIGIASHELKTPLTSLKGYLQLMGTYQKEELPHRITQYIEKANKALNKLQSLINDLLDVSKIQAGKLEYAFSTVNISELIRVCIENAVHIYPDNIFINEDGSEYLVNGNPERLEQVLMNLINNAVKYSHGNKKVIIKTTRHEHRVRVSVIDFGIGLSTDQKQRIFERFYRVEDKKHLTSGLGMGLYISTDIIHNHRGQIGVESELGKGAVFYFELPLIEQKGES